MYHHDLLYFYFSSTIWFEAFVMSHLQFILHKMETSTDYSMTDHEITPSDKQLTKHKNLIKKPIQTNNNNDDDDDDNDNDNNNNKGKFRLPERVTYDKKSHVRFLRFRENFVSFLFNHFSISKCNRFPIQLFLNTTKIQ